MSEKAIGQSATIWENQEAEVDIELALYSERIDNAGGFAIVAISAETQDIEGAQTQCLELKWTCSLMTHPTKLQASGPKKDNSVHEIVCGDTS